MKINWSPYVFVDTAGWIALLNPKDGLHSQAARVRNDLRQRRVRLVTTEFVLIEVADAFAEPPLRSVAFEFNRGLRQNNAPFAVEIVPVSEELVAKGWALYSQRPDKGWGLTDCTSFVIMQEYGIVEASATSRRPGVPFCSRISGKAVIDYGRSIHTMDSPLASRAGCLPAQGRRSKRAGNHAACFGRGR